MLGVRRGPWNYFAECEAAIARGCNEAVAVLEGLRGILDGTSPMFISTYACPFDGRYHWYQVAISPFNTHHERHALLMHVDVSALQRDALTRLGNRDMFDAQLDYVLALARDSARQTGVVFVDVNRLKALNDTHGHPVGDRALLTIAREIGKAVGPECLVARVGGDEFGVVLPVGVDTLTPRRVRAHFQKGTLFPVIGAPGGVFVSASVGLALYPADGTTAVELLKAADASMYAEKRGRSIA
jgi:diguanylate cyclase (GGDEF)-like protein